ncbi:RcpC/CpaB family pilus assembly protein [Effusibacillus consociatus]|uniref:RcpC/CpaB family pilus assembly protein n=1 Tax=Effusibacillus consociatus TaxID=1117041 RepID=A0ABV9Q1U3_9BACL
MIAGALTFAFASVGNSTERIVKAKTAIPKGQVLSEEWFETAEVPKREAWMIGNVNEIKGLIAKHDIAANEYLSKHDVSPKRMVTFMANEREFTVQTDLSRCVGGDLGEGDFADVLFFDKSTFQAQPLFTVSILEVNNRSGQTLNEREKEVRDSVPATVKIKVTTEQAAALLAFEQRGLVAFAKVPDEVVKQVANP